MIVHAFIIFGVSIHLYVPKPLLVKFLCNILWEYQANSSYLIWAANKSWFLHLIKWSVGALSLPCPRLLTGGAQVPPNSTRERYLGCRHRGGWWRRTKVRPFPYHHAFLSPSPSSYPCSIPPFSRQSTREAWVPTAAELPSNVQSVEASARPIHVFCPSRRYLLSLSLPLFHFPIFCKRSSAAVQANMSNCCTFGSLSFIFFWFVQLLSQHLCLLWFAKFNTQKFAVLFVQIFMWYVTLFSISSVYLLFLRKWNKYKNQYSCGFVVKFDTWGIDLERTTLIHLMLLFSFGFFCPRNDVGDNQVSSSIVLWY